jgi:chromosome segregation ATPase
VSAEVERLRTQHADAVREKSAADSKCRKLADKVAALEGEKTDLRRQLAEERKEANEALAKAQAETNLARVEGSLARERAEQLEERLSALQSRVERAEAATRTEAERTRKQLMDSYHELGARTADFEVSDREPGLCCLEYVILHYMANFVIDFGRHIYIYFLTRVILLLTLGIIYLV